MNKDSNRIPVIGIILFLSLALFSFYVHFNVDKINF